MQSFPIREPTSLIGTVNKLSNELSEDAAAVAGDITCWRAADTGHPSVASTTNPTHAIAHSHQLPIDQRAAALRW